MQYPVRNYKKWYIASEFGEDRGTYFHSGQDWNLKTGGNTDYGQDLLAVASGKIVYYHKTSHPSVLYGKHMVLRCETPIGTRWYMYAHCSKITAEVKEVKQGDVIGAVGKSGTKYSHLHLSVFKVDPKILSRGIDSVAKTQKGLHEYWEKFELLSSTKNFMPEKANTDLKKVLTHFNVKTADELISMVDEQLKFLKDAREKNTELQSNLDGSRARAKELEEKHQNFVDKTSSMVKSVADEARVIEGIEMLLSQEAQLTQKLSQAQKAYSLLESEKKTEIKELKASIAKLQQVNEDQAKHIERLSDRLDLLEKGKEIDDKFSKLIKSIFDFFKKGKS